MFPPEGIIRPLQLFSVTLHTDATPLKRGDEVDAAKVIEEKLHVTVYRTVVFKVTDTDGFG